MLEEDETKCINSRTIRLFLNFCQYICMFKKFDQINNLIQKKCCYINILVEKKTHLFLFIFLNYF